MKKFFSLVLIIASIKNHVSGQSVFENYSNAVMERQFYYEGHLTDGLQLINSIKKQSWSGSGKFSGLLENYNQKKTALIEDASSLKEDLIVDYTTISKLRNIVHEKISKKAVFPNEYSVFIGILDKAYYRYDTIHHKNVITINNLLKKLKQDQLDSKDTIDGIEITKSTFIDSIFNQFFELYNEYSERRNFYHFYEYNKELEKSLKIHFGDTAYLDRYLGEDNFVIIRNKKSKKNGVFQNSETIIPQKYDSIVGLSYSGIFALWNKGKCLLINWSEHEEKSDEMQMKYDDYIVIKKVYDEDYYDLSYFVKLNNKWAKIDNETLEVVSEYFNTIEEITD
ncbi:MAG: hypothetical protein ACLGGV_01625 [Bacteroidia bacterium]